MIDKKLYPFESHYFERDGHRMHYIDEGEGETLVMLHGNPSWSFYYRALANRFKKNYRVIVPDHMGCGLSDKPPDYPYTLERRVDDIEALLKHLGITHNVTLMLHDWGGMIGMAYASRKPERIKRLVLFNTGAFHLPADKPFPWQLRLSRTFLGPLLVKGLNLFCIGAAAWGVTRRPLSPEARAGLLAPYGSWAERVAILRFVQDIPLSPEDPGYDLVTQVQQGLSQFNAIPVLICWGLKDFVFDKSFLHVWKNHLPNAQVHTFDDCGHYVLEDASEEIVPLVAEFLEKHPLAAAAR